jgi:ATP-binding cassette, subfamily B, bacterial
MQSIMHPAARIWNLVREEKKEITSVYFYAILNGLIQLSLPVGIQSIIGFVLGGTLSASLILLISLIVTGVLLVGMMQVNQMKIIEKIQQKIFVRYAYAFADRIPKLDLKHVDSFYLPELVNRFFDTTSLQKSISKLLLDLPTATIQILFGLILLSFYHPAFILFGLVLLLLIWLILYSTGSKGLQSSLEESKYKYGVAGWFEEVARIVKTFKFSGHSLNLKKTDEKTIGYLKARTNHFGILLLQYKTLVAFKVIITAAMLIVGVLLLLQQQINIGQFVAAEIIILTVINSIEKIIVNLDNVYDTLTAVEKLSKLTDKPVEHGGSFELNTGNGLEIEAQNLEFAYNEKPVVKDLSFRMAANKKVAISGNEGSGKSTLIKLLTGIYTDFRGALLINSLPVANYDLQSLRKQTGILFLQENIFHGTLWENLAMDRDVDRNYVEILVRKTGLLPFLQSLPNGYDTELDPSGKRLPGNVIQKILIVRALSHQPRLLLLEEPWQGVEEQYKTAIQQLLLHLNNATVVVATNDEHFIGRCDINIKL